MGKEKRSAEQQVADGGRPKGASPTGDEAQTIADSQADPAFQDNHKRLKAERIARELEVKGKYSLHSGQRINQGRAHARIASYYCDQATD
jgi:hypothetical protein